MGALRLKHALDLGVIALGLERHRDRVAGAVAPEPAVLAVERGNQFALVTELVTPLAVAMIEVLRRVVGVAMVSKLTGLPALTHS